MIYKSEWKVAIDFGQYRKSRRSLCAVRSMNRSDAFNPSRITRLLPTNPFEEDRLLDRTIYVYQAPSYISIR